jgi:hypothetical protein
VTNILEAGLGGAVLGGGLKGLSALWTRQKTGAWPRTVRDAGNVVESEAQIAATRPTIVSSVRSRWRNAFFSSSRSRK